MKPLSFAASLAYSVVILSLAVYIGSFGAEVGLSYGWFEHLYRNHYFLYSALSSLLVLIGGIVLANAIIARTVSRCSKSYLSLLLYCSVMSLAVGECFLYISIASLFIVFTLAVVITTSRNSEPISGFIFKTSLAVCLLMFVHPAMIWLILPFAVAIVYFRPTVAKDMLVLFMSFLLFVAYFLWCKWFFDLDLAILIDIIRPKFSIFDSVLTNSVAIGMLVFIIGSWLSFRNNMSSMESMACKLEQYAFLCTFLLSVVLLVSKDLQIFIPLYAAPVSFLVFIHLESLRSETPKKLIVAIFYAVLVILAISMLYFSDLKELLMSFADIIKSHFYGVFY